DAEEIAHRDVVVDNHDLRFAVHHAGRRAMQVPPRKSYRVNREIEGNLVEERAFSISETGRARNRSAHNWCRVAQRAAWEWRSVSDVDRRSMLGVRDLTYGKSRTP